MVLLVKLALPVGGNFRDISTRGESLWKFGATHNDSETEPISWNGFGAGKGLSLDPKSACVLQYFAKLTLPQDSSVNGRFSCGFVHKGYQNDRLGLSLRMGPSKCITCHMIVLYNAPIKPLSRFLTENVYVYCGAIVILVPY